MPYRYCHRQFIVVFQLGIFAYFAANSSATFLPALAKPAAEDEKLKGHVELRDRLPPLDMRLGPGNSFDPQVLPRSTQEDQWIKIPPWFAGTWETKWQTTKWAKNELTGEEERYDSVTELSAIEYFGKQRDRQGNIWDYFPAGRITRTKLEDKTSINYVTAFDVVAVKDKEMIWRVDTINFLVDPATGKITSCLQKEQLITYKPRDEKSLESSAHTRAYDLDGSPFRTSQAFSVATLTEPFAVADNYKGQDMKALFTTYLKSHNLADLAP